MPHRDRPGAEPGLHRLRQFQQPDQVGHVRTVDRQPLGELVLRAAPGGEVLAEACRLFQGVEVAALQVLDDRDLGHAPVIDVEDADRHLLPSQPAGRRQPALAGDQLVAIGPAADHDRLHEAVLAQAGDELREVGVVDDAPRLPGIGVDAVGTDLRDWKGGGRLLQFLGRVEEQPGRARAEAARSRPGGGLARQRRRALHRRGRRRRLQTRPAEQGLESASQSSFPTHSRAPPCKAPCRPAIPVTAGRNR
jgi:hypothetical protein